MPRPRRRHSRQGDKSLDHWRIRRELYRLFQELAEQRALTYHRIATLCGTTEPRAWNLLHGKIEQVNSETLIDILARLGMSVDVIVTRRTFPRYHATDFE